MATRDQDRSIDSHLFILLQQDAQAHSEKNAHDLAEVAVIIL